MREQVDLLEFVKGSEEKTFTVTFAFSFPIETVALPSDE